MKFAATLALLSCLSLPFAARAQDPASTAPAVLAANQWLALMDAANYGHSWLLAANEFQAAIAKADWVATAQHARTPLGALKHRQLLSTQYTPSLPDAPAGEYVVIRYKTDYGNKPDAIETVTPKKGADGQWRVSGYFIY